MKCDIGLDCVPHYWYIHASTLNNLNKRYDNANVFLVFKHYPRLNF